MTERQGRVGFVSRRSLIYSWASNIFVDIEFTQSNQGSQKSTKTWGQLFMETEPSSWARPRTFARCPERTRARRWTAKSWLRLRVALPPLPQNVVPDLCKSGLWAVPSCPLACAGRVLCAHKILECREERERASSASFRTHQERRKNGLLSIVHR